MALDSEAKRWSMLNLANGGASHVINPSGSDFDSAVERLTLLRLYGGDLSATGAISAAGIAANDVVGSSTATGDLSATGIAVGAMTSDAEEAEEEAAAAAVPDGSGGAWAKASSNRRKQIKREDEELMMIMQRMAPQIMKHRRVLH